MIYRIIVQGKLNHDLINPQRNPCVVIGIQARFSGSETEGWASLAQGERLHIRTLFLQVLRALELKALKDRIFEPLLVGQ